MALEQLDAQKKKTPDWTTGTIAILLALVAVIFLAVPRYSAYRQNKQAIQNLNQQLADTNQKKTLVAASLSTIAKNQASFTALDQAIPAKPQLADVFALLETLAKSSNMQISTLQGDDPGNATDQAAAHSAPDQADAGIQTVPNASDVVILPIKIELRGTTDNFRTFLGNLEASLRLIDVQSINVNEAATNTLTFDVSLNTYYLK